MTSLRTPLTVTLAAAAAVALVAGCSSDTGDTSADTATSTSTAPNSVGGKPLRILLTNDDGWDAPGIGAVRSALVAAGHDVTVVAPSTNQSGASAQINPRGPVTATHPGGDDKVWSYVGSPADSVDFALGHVYGDGRPDLVISGTNAGANAGQAINFSGTVGAAVTAASQGVPAIAVSTDTAAGRPVTVADFADTATFLTRLVRSLPADSLVPAGVVLNVNYPVLAAGATPSSVAYVPTSDSAFATFDYTPTADGSQFDLKVGAGPAAPDGTDVATVKAGGVALSALDVTRANDNDDTDSVDTAFDTLAKSLAG